MALVANVSAGDGVGGPVVVSGRFVYGALLAGANVLAGGV